MGRLHDSKRLYEKASIGIICRPDTPPNHTVLTLKLLESWASATACISSRLKGIEEVSKENEDIIFFTPDNSDELAEKIILLCSNKELLKKLQINGIKKSHQFDWQNLIKKICDLVEDLKYDNG